MKVFLSHAMSGMEESDVLALRQKAFAFLSQYYKDVEIIDNYYHLEAPDNAGRLWHLGTSITQLDEADAIYFCDGSNSNGCIVELLISKLYNLRVLNREVGPMNDPITDPAEINRLVDLGFNEVRYVEVNDQPVDTSTDYGQFHYDENGRMLI